MALFLAGGIATVILLVVVLVSLEQHSSVQSALPEPSTSRPSTPALNEPSSTAAPETFTFYDTLEQRNAPSPGFMDESSRPSPRAAPPTVASPWATGRSPKKQPPRFTIQIAAVKDRPTAEALTDRLKRKGYPVFILPHVIPKQGTWYRVRVGHFAKRDAAREMARQISRQERLKTYIAKE
ncbi:MAG: SPOR domain-containing protein [Nitrospirae bacterium]|nr:SPOR domain-containing protein [Nitrospirota bacterium]